MIDFYFDVVCPYAWAASQQLDDLSRWTGRPIRWRPILLGGVLRSVGNVDVPMDAMGPVKAAYTMRDVQRQCARFGLQARYPDDHPRRTLGAMRLLTLLPQERLPEAAQTLWHAYWTDNADLSDADVLASFARNWGIDPAAIEAPETKQALRENTDAAVARGVFGVPTLAADDKLVWGSDRVRSLATALGATLEPVLPQGPFDVFHDFSSPYSYLGVMTVLRSDAAVRLRPMLLGALFKAIGTPVVPIATFNPTKAAWAQRDMVDQARHRGLPLRFPDVFPIRTVTPLRVALVEPATTGALYTAAWAQNKNIGEVEVLRAVLDAAGFDGARLIEASARPDIKAALRKNTDEAVAKGIPGAPSFVRRGEVFWGQDRLPILSHHEGLDPR